MKTFSTFEWEYFIQSFYLLFTDSCGKKTLQYIQSFCLLFQVCHGKGSSREASQTDAARRALVLLADSGDNLSAENEADEEDSGSAVNGQSASSIPIVSASAAVGATVTSVVTGVSGAANDDNQD